MHFCVSDRVSEWPSQIVLDKVHLRWEIEALRPTGGRSASAENGTANGERVYQGDKSRQLVTAASSKRMMSGEPKSPRIPALAPS